MFQWQSASLVRMRSPVRFWLRNHFVVYNAELTLPVLPCWARLQWFSGMGGRNVAKGQVEVVTLACQDCKQRNYTTKKNRKSHSGRLGSRSTAGSAGLILCTGKPGKPRRPVNQGERRTPNPMVGGSNPSGPAKIKPAIGWKDMNKLTRFLGSIGTFLRETRAELRKVVWPTWAQVRVLTAVVLFTMIGLGAILCGTDALVAFGLSAVLGR